MEAQILLDKVNNSMEWAVELSIALGGAIVAGLIWGLRLEGIVKQQGKDIERQEIDHQKLVQKHENLDQKIMDKFEQVFKALARIEERIIHTYSRGE